VPADGRVLEIGCGAGSLWVENLDRIPQGWEVTLSDLSPGMLDAAKRNLERAGRPFDFGVVDSQDLPFREHSLDAVVANHMLHHVPDRRAAFAEACRTLKPSGRLYAATNGRDHMCEVNDLIRRVHPEARIESIDFTLESGSGELGDWFRNVTLHQRPGHLNVDEVQPLIDYIRSYHPLTDAQVDELAEIIGRQLSEKGAFRISTSAGLFVADEPRQRKVST
jgi:SAM-dependent methyltransferase